MRPAGERHDAYQAPDRPDLGRPWTLFVWWYHYEAYAPDVFDKAGTLAGASGSLGCAGQHG